jgi:hypothetical protein
MVFMALTRVFSSVVATLLCFLALSVVAKADTITFTAVLSGANEVPPRQSNGTGAATVTLDDVTGKGTLTVGFTGLSAAVTGGHIHCCAGTNANGPVIVGFDSSLTLTQGGTTGALANFSFTLTPDQITAMKNGLTYVNIHTSAFPGGEIRGQLIAAGGAPVPEPGTLILLGAGLLSMAGALKKRRDQV